MKVLAFIVLALCALQDIKAQLLLGRLASRVRHRLQDVLVPGSCDRDVTPDFKRALHDFITKVYRRAAYYSHYNLVISPITMWLSLSAIAEGAATAEKFLLFKALNLPEEACARQIFYQLALKLDRPGNDVAFTRNRGIVFDEELAVNSDWSVLAEKTGLYFTSVPLKRDPEAVAAYLQNVMSLQSPITTSGNSLLIDSLDFQGLWMTAFPEAGVERAPFYDDGGNMIGQVDLMRMETNVRIAHLPFINAKVLELPVGANGRYTMLITMGINNQTIRKIMEIFQSSIIIEILKTLTASLIPLQIAIPKFTMTSEFDARPILEDIGINNIWNNPMASSNVSKPPAMPGGLIQRVTVTLGSAGVNSPPVFRSKISPVLYSFAAGTATGFASAVGRDFIANKPFMYSLIDTETKACIFAGAFSQPTYV